MEAQTKSCQNCKNDFTIEPDDFGFYSKIGVPAPTWCPTCRYKRRMIWRNVRHLFRGKDDITGKEIFRQLPPESNIPVYELSYWNSDKWDSLDYGREYDFSRTFFDQLNDLFKSVPFPALSVIGSNVGSEYCNQIDYPKNCYLVFDASNPEDSAYGINVGEIKNCLDMTTCFSDEFCYDCTLVENSHRAIGSVECDSCTDIWFSKNCIGCMNCFGCVNLRNQKYQIFNKQYTKEEYSAIISSFNLDKWSKYYDLKNQAHEFWKKFPVRYMIGIKNHIVSGEDIKYSKNVKKSHTVYKSEDMKYCQNIPGGASNSYDYTVWGEGATLIYESACTGMQTSNIKFSFDIWPSSKNIEYSIICRRVSDCFGCVGMKDKQYCILNKQYTKEEYFDLLPKIKKHMSEMPYVSNKGIIYKYGEFFPIEFSPFAYNESILFDEFSISEDNAIHEGFKWNLKNKKSYTPTIDVNNLMDSIHDTNDDILNEIIDCQKCGEVYRIIPMELTLLRQLKIPIPRLCLDCRFKDRMKFKNPINLWNRQCMCQVESHNHTGECSNEFETAYAPNRPEIVYCEKCYQQEVI